MKNLLFKLKARWTYFINADFCDRNALTLSDVKKDLEDGWKYPSELKESDRAKHNWRFKRVQRIGKKVLRRFPRGLHVIKYHPDDEIPYQKYQEELRKSMREFFEEMKAKDNTECPTCGRGGKSSGGGSKSRKKSGGGSSSRSNSPSVCNNHGSGL